MILQNKGERKSSRSSATSPFFTTHAAIYGIATKLDTKTNFNQIKEILGINKGKEISLVHKQENKGQEEVKIKGQVRHIQMLTSIHTKDSFKDTLYCNSVISSANLESKATKNLS